MRLTVLILYFWLILVESVLRRLYAAFAFIFLRILIVLTEGVHLFVIVVRVEGLTVEEHLVSVGWRI